MPLPEFCPVSGDWGEIPNFGTSVSNKRLLNAANARGTAFIISE